MTTAPPPPDRPAAYPRSMWSGRGERRRRELLELVAHDLLDLLGEHERAVSAEVAFLRRHVLAPATPAPG